MESVTASHTRFETAIADKILGEAVNTLPHLPASQRLNYLKRYLGQFESGVDLSRVSNRIKREGALLRFLTEVEATRQEGLDFAANLQQLSTLNRTPNEIEQALQQELRRIDQRLMADKPDSDIQSLIKVQRRAATYPADTADSKQQYLDDLSTAMLRTQADWHDLLIEYAPSVLAISGHESNQGPTFSYEARGLAINLGNPQDLPIFEIPCLAAYYGYPGLQAFSTQKQVGIKTLLDLPAYTHGWASYVVDLISEQPEGNQCLWFSRLQAVTALADLRFNRGEWTRQTALDYLEQNTPYNQSRLTGIVDEIITEPGRNLALFAGRLFFGNL